MGAAVWTGIGLGMEPPVKGIIILSLTYRAHGEFSHGGLGPVIGDIFNNGIPGAAIGAVDKRVFIPPVFRVKHLI